MGFLQLLTTDGGTATSTTTNSAPFGTPTASPTESTPTPTATLPPFTYSDPQSLEQATVLEVIDGDTIVVLIGSEAQRVRYYGIDAPDKGKQCFNEATERNRELVGRTVRLKSDVRDQDDSGRLLRYVFTEEGLSVDAALVTEGLAKAWRQDGFYRDPLIGLEDHARTQDIGCLWK
ncbi:MAG: thermonuclease family protein [Chloroflexota bacterium]|nr:thermonuclease family protein [Chloroflexota bacterium]